MAKEMARAYGTLEIIGFVCCLNENISGEMIKINFSDIMSDIFSF